MVRFLGDDVWPRVVEAAADGLVVVRMLAAEVVVVHRVSEDNDK